MRQDTRWKPGYGTHKRWLSSKIHLAVDAHGMSVKIFIQQVKYKCRKAAFGQKIWQWLVRRTPREGGHHPLSSLRAKPQESAILRQVPLLSPPCRQKWFSRDVLSFGKNLLTTLLERRLKDFNHSAHHPGTISQPAKGNLFKGPFHIPRMMTKGYALCQELLSEK